MANATDRAETLEIVRSLYLALGRIVSLPRENELQDGHLTTAYQAAFAATSALVSYVVALDQDRASHSRSEALQAARIQQSREE